MSGVLITTEQNTGAFRAEQVRRADYGWIGELYEDLLGDGFSQSAYMAKDLLLYGEIRPETQQRVDNELIGTALEKLGEPFITKFFYEVKDGDLIAEDGESLTAMLERALHLVKNEARRDPRLNFLVSRFAADLEFRRRLVALANDERQPDGNALAAASPCPDAIELGIPEQILKDHNYRPEVDQAMLWIGKKLNGGIELTTINFFHSVPDKLSAMMEQVTGQRLLSLERESMPHQIIPVGNVHNLAEKFQAAFDSYSSLGLANPTFHGLTAEERSQSIGAEMFIAEPGFQTVRAAAHEVLTEVASSLTSQELRVNLAYLQAMLDLKRPNGRHEVEGSLRSDVLRVISGTANQREFRQVMHAVQQVAKTSVWAEMARIYFGHNSPLTVKILDSETSSTGVAIASIQNIGEQRAAGRAENGCPGGGLTSTKDSSLFDMSDAQILGELFSDHKEIKTNCPMCRGKNVTAEISHGTITCKSCRACVEICTGKVLRKAQRTQRVKQIAETFWEAVFGLNKKPESGRHKV